MRVCSLSPAFSGVHPRGSDMVLTPVEVVGFIGNRCPLLRFAGKADAVVDIFGEKLNESHVRGVITQQLTRFSIQPSFWMLAPEQVDSQSGCYTLFVQFPKAQQPTKEDLRGLSLAVDEKLQENYGTDADREILEALKTELQRKPLWLS